VTHRLDKEPHSNTTVKTMKHTGMNPGPPGLTGSGALTTEPCVRECQGGTCNTIRVNCVTIPASGFTCHTYYFNSLKKFRPEMNEEYGGSVNNRVGPKHEAELLISAGLQ